MRAFLATRSDSREFAAIRVIRVQKKPSNPPARITIGPTTEPNRYRSRYNDSPQRPGSSHIGPMANIVERERVHSIVGGFYEVYNYFGFGFLEPLYSGALTLELRDRGHKVDREVLVDIKYKGPPRRATSNGYRRR